MALWGWSGSAHPAGPGDTSPGLPATPGSPPAWCSPPAPPLCIPVWQGGRGRGGWPAAAGAGPGTSEWVRGPEGLGPGGKFRSWRLEAARAGGGPLLWGRQGWGWGLELSQVPALLADRAARAQPGLLLWAQSPPHPGRPGRGRFLPVWPHCLRLSLPPLALSSPTGRPRPVRSSPKDIPGSRSDFLLLGSAGLPAQVRG